jgi:selenocysteine lyase/cysteine desulfurase
MAESLGLQRHRFDIPDEVAYLNCAYFSPQPRAVREAGLAALNTKAHPWKVVPGDFFTPGERLRELFAGLVNGDGDGVGFAPSVSYAVGVAARNVEVGPGRNVVMLAEQFSSDVYPWRAKVAEDGGGIVTVPHPGDAAWTDALVHHIDDDTAVVAVSNVHWTDGRKVDLVKVGEAARSVGAALVVDVSQSLGAVRFDVEAVQPDFVVAVGYKWLMGPYSHGYLWAAPHRRGGMPIEQTWTSRMGSEDFSRLVDYTDELKAGARRYDYGEWSNFTLLPMATAALELIAELTPEGIGATIAPLTDRLERGAVEIGLQPVRSQHRFEHMMGVRFPGGIPGALRPALAAADVHVSVRSDSVRVSPNVYNTESDIDRLLEVFDTVA